MIYLIEHPDKIVRMGNESYSIALEKFDVNKINPILEKLIVGGVNYENFSNRWCRLYWYPHLY